MQVSVNDPSAVVTVITVVPIVRALATPEGETVAMRGSLDENVTDLFVAATGATVAASERAFPTTTEEFFGAIVTPVTGTMLTPF